MSSSKDAIIAFMAKEFPQNPCVIEQVGSDGAIVRHHVGEADLRPGGTVSGPTLMMLADVAIYVAVLGKVGIVPLAVTSSLTINFLRKPPAGAGIRGECKLLKAGRTLAVGEVLLYSDGMEEPVAHAVGTYAIPAQDRTRDA